MSEQEAEAEISPTEGNEEVVHQTIEQDDQGAQQDSVEQDSAEQNEEPNLNGNANPDAGDEGEQVAAGGEGNQAGNDGTTESAIENVQVAGDGENNTGDNEAAVNDDSPEKQAAVDDDSPEKQAAVDDDSPEKQAAVDDDSPEKQAAVDDDSPEKQAAVDDHSPEQEAVKDTEPENDDTQAEDDNADQAQAEAVEETENPEDSAEQEEDVRIPSPEVTREAAGTATEPTDDRMEVDPHCPTPELTVDPQATATVKFFLVPSGDVSTRRCKLVQNLGDLKKEFAQEFRVSPKDIMFMFDGINQTDHLTLAHLGVGPNATIQLEMKSANPEQVPLLAFKPRQEYHMPDVITVRVDGVEGAMDIVVEVERATRQKPFLGGYRHKKNGVEFHHAASQTMQKARDSSLVDRFCRDTQTLEERHILQQTTNEMSTQMSGVGVYVSNMKDKLTIPGKYTTADEFKSNRMTKVVIIQKYYRRWLAKRYVEKVREDKEARIEWERQEELRKKKEKEDRIKKEFERRMNPKTKEDFDLLYHALERWRQEEVANIDETLTGAERKAALCQLLDQETQLIASIGRHKLSADSDNKQKMIKDFLDKAASPKRWKGADGKTTEMDTPYTLRAQQLRDIYNSINMRYLTQDERLDVLLTVKHTVKEHDCKLTQEIIQLIDREADLLMRGVKEANLEGLRKRISTLFLQYIKTPVFNPEAARLLKVPQDPQVLRKNIYFCQSCNKYLPSTEFQLSSNSCIVGKCRACRTTENKSTRRQDLSHYRYMLSTLRRSEEEYNDGSQIAFLLQESDLRYLVENVWSGQSVVSSWEDLYDLLLVRWDKHKEWSPWNCILLTKEETTAHGKLHNLEEAYSKGFTHKVQQKHTLARNYFSRLPGMAEHVRAQTERDRASRGPSVTGRGLSATPTLAVN